MKPIQASLSVRPLVRDPGKATAWRHTWLLVGCRARRGLNERKTGMAREWRRHAASRAGEHNGLASECRRRSIRRSC